MKSIRSKIIILLFCSVFMSAVIIGFLGVVTTTKIIQEDTKQNMNLLCETHAKELEQVFVKVEDSVKMLAHYAEEELPSTGKLLDKSFRDKYTSALEKSALHHIESTEGSLTVYVRYDQDLIQSIDGFFYVRNKETGEFEWYEPTDVTAYAPDDVEHVGWWYKTIEKGEGMWHDVYYNANIEERMISYVIPLYKEGQLFGVVGTDISVDYISEKVQAISLFETGKAGMIEVDGTIVSHPVIEEGKEIDEYDQGFRIVVEQLAKQEQTEELISYKMDGVEKKLSGYKLRNGMILVCFAPQKEIFRDQNHLISVICLIGILDILVSLAIAIAISRKITSPIKKLSEASKRIADGDFNVEINKVYDDEVGDLTDTFLQMQSILKSQFTLLDAEAHRDGLTGVGNKSAFIDREEEINQQINDEKIQFAVAVFDVNKLKITNDVFGHLAGDRLLLVVATHLSRYFGDENVFRTGGDEFVVIDTEENEEKFDVQIEACVSSMKKCAVEGFSQIRVSCAYGTAHFDDKKDREFSDVLRKADKEMYINKTLTKQESFPWEEGEKGFKKIQNERYCDLLKTLSVSTEDNLYMLDTETRDIHFFRDNQMIISNMVEFFERVHKNDRGYIRREVSKVVNHEVETIDINFRYRFEGEGNVEWVNCRGNIIQEDSKDKYLMIGRLSRNAIKHLYNPLTTLYNKNKLKIDIQDEHAPHFTCLLLLDVDNISELNLRYGSAYGDEILLTLANELEKRFTMDQLYHAEKDRFVVLLDANSSKDVKKVFHEIQEALESKCSISASVVPNERNLYVDADNIYDYAVQVLNNSKLTGTGQIVFFSTESLLERLSAVEFLEEIQRSVKNKCAGFSLVFQPQIWAEDGSLFAAEALLRYTTETGEMVYPDRFIPILEKTGLITEVGLWVADNAMAQCAKWRQSLPDFHVSINISTVQLRRKKNALQIVRLLEKHNLPSDAVVLEITESAQVEKSEGLKNSLEIFKKAGIKIAIDDFGTGYSNLGYLKQMHAQIIKVDRMFVKDIQEDNYNFNLICNIIDFAKKNGIMVCLEGVETEQELTVLRKLKADLLQGYFFDKPITPSNFENKYLNRKSDKLAE